MPKRDERAMGPQLPGALVAGRESRHGWCTVRGRASAGPLLLTAGIVVAAPRAYAHEFWLVPSSYVAGRGDTVNIRAYVGRRFRGEPKPYATTRVVRFELHGGSKRDLAPVGRNGDFTYARFVLPDAGGAIVVYESNYIPIELAADQFDHYLELEGLDGPRAQRAARGAAAGPGRETCRRGGGARARRAPGVAGAPKHGARTGAGRARHGHGWHRPRGRVPRTPGRNLLG